MAFGIGDDLESRISANTQDFERGIETAQRSLDSLDRATAETAAGLQALQGRADETSEEVTDLGGDATATAQALGVVSEQADDAALSFGRQSVAGSSAEESLSDLGLEALQTAATLQLLANRSNDAEREVDSLGRSSTTTAGQLGGLSVAAEGAGFSIHGLSGSIILSLVPALGTLLAALTPVLAGLTGIVTIGAAIGGIGLVAAIGGIATHADQMKVVFNELVDVVRDEFAPVFDLAAEALFILMGEFMDIIPELVPAQDVISRLAANFLDLGSALIDSLPAFVELATTLAEEFLPPFVTWTEEFLPQVPGMITELADVTGRVIPLFMAFGRELVRLLGPLNEFGETALSVIAVGLGRMNDAIIFTLRSINSLSEGMSRLVASGSLVLPFIVGFVSLLGGPATAALVGVIASVAALAKAFETNFANIRTFLTGLWNEFQSILPSIRNALDAFIDGVDISDISDAFSDFEDILGEQLLITLENLKPVFDDIQTLLEDNKEEIGLIGGVIGDLITAGIKLAGFFAQFLGPAIQTFIIEPFRAFIDILDFALEQLGNLIESYGELQEGDIQGAANVFANRPQDAPVAPQLPSLAEAFGSGGGNNPTEVQLSGELQFNDDGELVALVDERAETTVNNEQRRTRRNQGRQPNPN